MSTTRRRSSGKFAAPVVKSTVRAPKTTIDESRAAVSATDSLQAALNGSAEPIEISSDEESEEEVSDEEMGAPDAETADTRAPVNGEEDTAAAENNTSPKADAEGAESEDEGTSPTFGEMLRGTIDVPAVLSQQGESNKAVVSASRKNLAAPSLSSLSTVLTQALKTEDTDLLESCLQVNHLETIQQTIERLDSSLAGILLTKLAARFHRRPGRAGSLMTWVKWTLVSHGGALAVQPKVLERLVSLQKVLNERSRGLPSLLALKGKLDMLDAQMQLRKGRQRRRRGQNQVEDADEDDEEEGAIYVEGEEDGETDVDAIIGSRKALLGDDDDDEIPATNGLIGDSDDDEDDDDVAAAEDESDGEEAVDEDEVDHDDVEESEDDDDSDAEAAPPAKVQKTASSFTKRK
ncbi:U3 small nucleolar RNA-associated protein 5 [Colletotrichum chlorophyti]|uniref:U3 small nucleolar RNA-associated protein 5 n=1 Tax=Colletotrichum chlorophyti TaxID=708187 RepID=A0A1Q8RCB2_9PEZI|nr:U3 small nucleolar RNA-associated protein 5 [Colletotrichum chlorophyti]